MSRSHPLPSVVGRLAPSPTGDLHLGHARSFLVAWWLARRQRGRVVLRLEDLDRARCQSRFIDGVREDLEWLGLDWDGPELLQSEGLDRIRASAMELTTTRRAYPCVCSRGDIQAVLLAPHGPMNPQPNETDARSRYPGTCRGRWPSIAEAEHQSNKLAGLRFQVPNRTIAFTDLLAGRQRENLRETVGDFLVLRRDKTPSYQLAVVCDDAAAGVTDVVRGADLLASTASQLALHEALGLSAPRYLHLPLVTDEHGRRLAKRHDALSLRRLRQAGTDPRAIVLWALQSCGVTVSERLSAEEGQSLLDPESISRQPVAVGSETITWLLDRT